MPSVVVPASSRAAGTYARSTSMLPRPFCSVRTSVCGPIAPAAAAATAAVCVALANTITRSAGSGAAGNGAAGTRTIREPVSSEIRSPASLIADTCSRHPSSSSTSCPASNSAPPNRHPIAPAPANLTLRHRLHSRPALSDAWAFAVVMYEVARGV